MAFHGQAQTGEQKFLENLQQNRLAHPGMEHFMKGVSNSNAYISLSVPVVLFAIGSLNHEKEMQKKSIVILETIGVSTVLELSLKKIVNRPRPSASDPNIIPDSDQGSGSFPSGHASQAFATATALSIAYPKWYVIAPSMLWATTVSFSRMYLGVHYPTDVLAGAVVGAGSAWLTLRINHWLFDKKKQ